MKKKKGNVLNIFLIIMLLAGLSLVLYPTVSHLWNSKFQARMIATYEESVGNINEETYRKILGDARQYNASLLERLNGYILTDQQKALYDQQLNVTGDGIMGYIEIPSINVFLAIYHGTDDTVLQVAAGHLEWTSLPIGGEGVHTVLSAHRGLPSARLFTDLDQLQIGDTFLLHILHETLTYQVDQIRIVLPEETEELLIQEGRDLCTLVTCTPYGVNSHRLLVRGHRVENAAQAVEVRVSADALQVEPLAVAAVLFFPILLLILAVNRIVERTNRKKKKG